MKDLIEKLSTDPTVNQQRSLAMIKRKLYQMIAETGMGEETGYEQVAEALVDLTFDVSCEEYKAELLRIVKEMITLDDPRFDIDLLYCIKEAFATDVGPIKT